MRGLLLSILLLGVSDALLEFDYSVVYDMEDFHGTPYYEITFCEPGCRVFLTYLNEPPLYLGDQDVGPFTIELDEERNITFYDLNRLYRDDGQKDYFNIPIGTKKFYVHNPNGNGVSRPLALWVILDDALYGIDLEVYDAVDQGQIETSATRIMLMSIPPFTATAEIEGEYSLTVKTSPFDMLSHPEYNTISSRFSLPFNSPIISIGFDSTNHGTVIYTDYSFPYVRSIDSSGYLASPGYIGCANKTFVFRSESYNFGVTSYNETFLVEGDSKRHVSFYGDLNTDDWAPILLYDMDTEDAPMEIIGMQSDNTSNWEYELDTSKFSIAWDALTYWRNESFMVRYEVDTTTTLPTKATVRSTTKTPPTVTTTVPAKTSTALPTSLPTSTAESLSSTISSTTTILTTSSSIMVSIMTSVLCIVASLIS